MFRCSVMYITCSVVLWQNCINASNQSEKHEQLLSNESVWSGSINLLKHIEQGPNNFWCHTFDFISLKKNGFFLTIYEDHSKKNDYQNHFSLKRISKSHRKLFQNIEIFLKNKLLNCFECLPVWSSRTDQKKVNYRV